MEEIVNRVASSGLLSLDLKELRPEGPRMALDLAPMLHMGLVLREKDFREALQSIDWASYADALVALHCSADAIVPQWAWMLLATKLGPHASAVTFGSLEDLENSVWQRAIHQLDLAPYAQQRVIVKGCSDVFIPTLVWPQLSARLLPVVRSLMYGEPCSNVPIYKAKQA